MFYITNNISILDCKNKTTSSTKIEISLAFDLNTCAH